MNTHLLSSFDTLPYFTTEAVKQLLGDGSAPAGTVRTALYRWMKTGRVIPLKKGVYMTRRFYDLHRMDADFIPAICAILIPTSYLSTEYVLQQSGILTETTYPVTAVTLKQTRVIENELGVFTFRHIRENLYRGFTISNYQGISFSRAAPAKALFDYFYFRPWHGIDLWGEHSIAEELRLNLDEFTQNDRAE